MGRDGWISVVIILGDLGSKGDDYGVYIRERGAPILLGGTEQTDRQHASHEVPVI